VSGARLLALCGLALSTTACVRGCTSSRPPIHPNPNMQWQPRYDPQEESQFFYDGSTMRQPVPGTVARGRLHDDPALWTGKDAAGQFLKRSPVEDSPEIVVRGAARFAIYCQPCHDKHGNGHGILFERGGVPTPSFHEQRIRDLPDGEIFDTITNGKGLMQSYAFPVPPEDRWAIIAHIRRLERDHLAEAGVAPGS
jgi:mono/diheme cytochrome c family protein